MAHTPLRIAIISDIHFGSDHGTKQCSRGDALFEHFANWLTGADVDLCVDLGDRICSVDRETDLSLMSQVARWFKQLPVPRSHLLGNHDIEVLNQEDNQRILEQPVASHSVEMNGWRLVFWQVSSALDKKLGFSIPKSDVDWLENELHRSKTPTVIFTHVPLDNGAIEGNYYFERAFPHHAAYRMEDARRIRSVIEQAESVGLCVNGHAHWNAYHAIDGIHYFTVASLTEAFPTYPAACEAWSLLTLAGDDITLEVFGNLPISYKVKLKRPLDRHWLNMDKPYAPQMKPPG